VNGRPAYAGYCDLPQLLRRVLTAQQLLRKRVVAAGAVGRKRGAIDFPAAPRLAGRG
jgi:hypothetical protein